ncbi:hypothetical protein FD723_39650 (plasmid) [Nostoc sp. C052]|uniref:hypothetical protein n=1 Tax=Nostoc sp. C052 TaxID=2576902 RepID=UPI0015C3CD38|nr:hypothetical protein [Nostoc sp. C052]QLE46327.1 hypothetical protein FD723_39650 [Nostoc sp. C052]
MDDTKLTTVNLLLESDVGTAAWEWGTSSDTGETYPIFLLKVFPGEANTLIPLIHIKAITIAPRFLTEPVALVIVLYSIGDSDYLYETWINHYSIELPSPFVKLVEMEKLHFAIYEESPTPQRIITINNSANWQTALTSVSQYQSWSMEAFSTAKATCCQKYSKQQLWQLC